MRNAPQRRTLCLSARLDWEDAAIARRRCAASSLAMQRNHLRQARHWLCWRASAVPLARTVRQVRATSTHCRRASARQEAPHLKLARTDRSSDLSCATLAARHKANASSRRRRSPHRTPSDAWRSSVRRYLHACTHVANPRRFCAAVASGRARLRVARRPASARQRLQRSHSSKGALARWHFARHRRKLARSLPRRVGERAERCAPCKRSRRHREAWAAQERKAPSKSAITISRAAARSRSSCSRSVACSTRPPPPVRA